MTFLARWQSKSPEVRYLLALCRAFVESAPPPPAGDVNLEAVTAMVRAHHLSSALGPFLLDALGKTDAALTLRKIVGGLHRRHGLVWLELERVTSALEEARVPHVTLKGLALGQTVYPRPEQRFVSDMDVLVAPDRFEQAMAALEAIGYSVAETAREPAFYRRHHFHLILIGPARVPLELHWDLSRPGDYFRFDVAGFLDRSRAVEREGCRLRVPSDTDQLLHGACQSLRDGFADLRRIVDAALLVRHGAARQADLPALARQQGMASPLWLLLETQHRLLGLDGAEGVANAVQPRVLARTCLRSLEVPYRAVTQEALRWIGIKRWLVWICAPAPGVGLSLVSRFLRPGEAELLDAVNPDGPRAGGSSRARWRLAHFVSLLKLAAFQLWCLARRPFLGS